MKELTNQCLHHIAGGSDDYDDMPSGCCEECWKAGIGRPKENTSTSRGLNFNFSTALSIVGGVFGTPGRLIGGGYGVILDNLDFEGRSRSMLEKAAKDYRNGDLSDYD